MQQAIQIAQYAAFISGLVALIWANAKFFRRTRGDIREENSKWRKHYATHGLKYALLRIVIITLTLAITVRYGDLKVFWGVFLVVYLAGFVTTTWMMTKRLPDQLPKITADKVNREISAKWWSFAFQFIVLAVWLYSWRHLYM